MWAALALTTVLNVAPAQLELKNDRMTYGVLGQERKDDNLYPGEMLVVAFDIEGLKIKDDGRVLYAMGIELVKNEKGKEKSQFKREPQDLEAVNSLGGSTLPSFALTLIGPDTAPGEYTLRVTVKDRQVKPEQVKVLKKTFKVVPPKLGFVRVRFTSSAGEPVPPVGVPGQRVYLHCALVGFETAKGKDKLTDITFEMSVLDDAGKPTLAKPFKGPIKEDVKNRPLIEFVPMPIELNRAGKFKVAIKATCNVSKKNVSQTLDLNVLGK
jgi:hypothetical protein